jgi:hypothetical protein
MLARSDRSKEPLLDRILSIVGPSFDGVEVLYDEGRPISDFGAQRNRLIEIGEHKGFDWMVQLDSDECMFPQDIATLRSLMVPPNRLLLLPRYEFARDFDHYDPTEYPDYQGRTFRLGCGYRFRRRVHEGLYRRFSPLSERRLGVGVFSDATPIYHYGRIKDTATMLLKLHNYELLAKGEAPVSELPGDAALDEDRRFYRELAPFPGPHPLKGSPAS